MSGHVQDRGPVVLGVSVAMIVVSSVFVALRFVSRVGIVRRVGWDDYTILLAWVREARVPTYGPLLTTV
jgi:hypothetical protein